MSELTCLWAISQQNSKIVTQSSDNSTEIPYDLSESKMKVILLYSVLEFPKLVSIPIDLVYFLFKACNKGDNDQNFFCVESYMP